MSIRYYINQDQRYISIQHIRMLARSCVIRYIIDLRLPNGFLVNQCFPLFFYKMNNPAYRSKQCLCSVYIDCHLSYAAGRSHCLAMHTSPRFNRSLLRILRLASFTEITEVNLSAFVYRLYHENVSPIYLSPVITINREIFIKQSVNKCR